MARAGPKSGLPPSSFRAVALVGAPVRWTYQPGSHRRKVTQDFSSTFLLRWAFLIDVAVALKCFGVATSYLVVVGCV
ncbi:unnamed protein product [Ascophyllum nodosum]